MVECSSEGLLCIDFVLFVIMADPYTNDILFGRRFPQFVLSSTRFRYGTVESGTVGTEFDCVVL